MKVANLGNMAADGLLTTMALQSVGVEAELIVNPRDFACAQPEWELADYGRDITVNMVDSNMDPYSVTEADLKSDGWRRPDWIKTLHYGRMYQLKAQTNRLTRKAVSAVRFVTTVRSVLDAVKTYDVVEAHVPFPIYLQWGKTPYIIYEAGWIRFLTADTPTRLEKLGLRGYRHAAAIIYTNPDMWHIFRQHKIAEVRRVFVPFAIDTDRYKPVWAGDIRELLAPRGEFLVLGMARQNWSVKGSDILIRGFAQFHKYHTHSKLILMNWGDDLKRSNDLVHQLGIQDAVTWLPFMPKSKIILLYNAVDVACDQFKIGCWGTSYPEAMACGCPTLIFYHPTDILRAFGSLPPIASVPDETELSTALAWFYRNGGGYAAEYRDWIKATHSMQLVGEKHKRICEEVLR